MNTNTMELNLNEMEMVNGGWSWDGFVNGVIGGAYGGACIGATVGAAALGVCRGCTDD